MCVCSLKYRACNAHAPYCHLWPAPLYIIFFHIISQKKVIEHKICVLIFYIQGVSRLEDITEGGDFLGLSDQKISYKHVSDFGLLRSYDRLKLRIEGNDY